MSQSRFPEPANVLDGLDIPPLASGPLSDPVHWEAWCAHVQERLRAHGVTLGVLPFLSRGDRRTLRAQLVRVTEGGALATVRECRDGARAFFELCGLYDRLIVESVCDAWAYTTTIRRCRSPLGSTGFQRHFTAVLRRIGEVCGPRGASVRTLESLLGRRLFAELRRYRSYLERANVQHVVSLFRTARGLDWDL